MAPFGVALMAAQTKDFDNLSAMPGGEIGRAIKESRHCAPAATCPKLIKALISCLQPNKRRAE